MADGKENRVHVGFGFHVNCYHSYRGDTPDELGFGGDIRTIRHIIDTLNQCNEENIPVKGTWDFENAYTLEKILPEYAPDIIENIKIRQALHGDENILMGYNNGALSAMTEDEFMASVQWAVKNHKHSGLQDIFGDCAKIIRPQEVMFTPGNARLYQKAGIEAVCLYYSCVPFDAFRTLIPQLADEDAFNPLTYQYKKGSITILPMYSHSDILDVGSLRYLVSELHAKQCRGEIRHDVFLFINIDADSFLWEPMPVPDFMKKWSNFNGLEGLIREIADLDYIVFDTPGNYLKNHKPLKKISFGEDVADGNFSGYSSWAEKPFNRLIWTRLEKARIYARLAPRDSLSPSFEKRIKLLSTTHFGLAAPVLNLEREKRALALSEQMLSEEKDTLRSQWERKPHAGKKNTIWIKNTTESALLGMQLTLEEGYCKDIDCLYIKGKWVKRYVSVPTSYWEDGSVKNIYLLCRFRKFRKKYKLSFLYDKDSKEKQKKKETTAAKKLSAQPMTGEQSVAEELKIKDVTGMEVVRSTINGFPQIYMAWTNTLVEWKSWINYDNQRIPFDMPKCEQYRIAGEGKGMRFSGAIHLPEELEAGCYEFIFFQMKKEKGIYLISKVKYPYTKETDAVSSKSLNLGRYCDMKWIETAPMEMTISLQKEAMLVKRNFCKEISKFALADFWKAFPQNENIDSFNHQLTGGVLALHDKEKGIAIAHARQVLGSMAHCPMRLRTKNARCYISINPFGTYFGRQRYYPTRGNGSVMELYDATMPQARSLAPSYNGISEMSIQRISDWLEIYEKEDRQEMTGFMEGALLYGCQGAVSGCDEDNIQLHDVEKNQTDVGRLKPLKALGNTSIGLAGIGMRFLKNIYHARKKEKHLSSGKDES